MGHEEFEEALAAAAHPSLHASPTMPMPKRTVTFGDGCDAFEQLPQQRPRQDSRDHGDCRTRSYVQKNLQKAAVARSQSLATDSSHVSGTPARIFEHTRGVANGDRLGRQTLAWHPQSWADIEAWLENLVASAMTKPSSAGNECKTSSIKIVFLNEKRCHKTFRDEVCDFTSLHPYLKVADWSTAHYMTSYCRFPLPLDVEEDPSPGAYNWDYRYSVSHPFDWDMLWAYFPQTKTTASIVRTWFDNYDADFQDMETTIETFSGPSLANPLILGLFALQILTSDTMANVREKGNRLFEAQKLTGFHTYSHLRSTDAAADEDENETGNLGAVTREILGAASNMTGWDNAAVQLMGFARFLMEENMRYEATAFASSDDRTLARLRQYINEQALKQISDLEGAKRDALAWLATATFLLQGVLNLVSQQDAHVNISLAKSSNRIAMDAKRDSTSMMAIAAVTMFFLPGTFTSSFFALPFFDNFMEGQASIWLYWTVTIPLTVIVMLAYRVWISHTRSPSEKLSNKEKA